MSTPTPTVRRYVGKPRRCSSPRCSAGATVYAWIEPQPPGTTRQTRFYFCEVHADRWIERRTAQGTLL